MWNRVIGDDVTIRNTLNIDLFNLLSLLNFVVQVILSRCLAEDFRPKKDPNLGHSESLGYFR